MLRCFLIFTVLFGLFKSFCEEEKPEKRIYPDHEIVRAYDKINNCSIGPEITSLDQMKDICRALIESPLCQGFLKLNLKNCDNIRRTDLRYADEKPRAEDERWRANVFDYEDYNYEDNEGLSGKILSCLLGGLFGMFQIVTGVGVLLSAVIESTILKPFDLPDSTQLITLKESFGMLKNYYAVEYENAQLEESLTPMLKAMVGLLLKTWDANSYRYACLSSRGKVEHACTVMTQMAAAGVSGGMLAPLNAARALQGVAGAGRILSGAATAGSGIVAAGGVVGVGALGNKHKEVSLRRARERVEERKKKRAEEEKNNKQ